MNKQKNGSNQHSSGYSAWAKTIDAPTSWIIKLAKSREKEARKKEIKAKEVKKIMEDAMKSLKKEGLEFKDLGKINGVN